MFRPLAYTKSFAIAFSSVLAITVVPVLMVLFIRGRRLRPEEDNPISRFFQTIYLPVIRDEEAFLRKAFPEFEEYARRVPRIVPRLKGRSAAEGEGPAGFSLELYLKHREYKALLGAVGMMAALVVKMIRG